MKPDLRKVTLVMMDHRRPAAAVRLLAAHAAAMEFGDIKLLNFFEGYAQSNYWMNYEAWKYVKTKFALFVQFDGYVLDPGLWDPAFLHYDFVGAPWPESWVWEKTVAGRVGNDGFCLKSRRLLRRMAELPWIDRPSDSHLSANQELLEAEGMNFAPVRVAARFSVENLVPETPCIEATINLEKVKLSQTFGFHGPKGCPRFLVWHDERTKI